MAVTTGGAAHAAATAGQPAGAHVSGTGWATQQGPAYAYAQSDARSKCASYQVVQRVSEDIHMEGSGWRVNLVLVCG
ncbi:hypothetical protein [Streptomyces cellulosae]|uniref:hypothetical protein n=1 Tax=Streptomyces cellulosae TaxID=1968 RepID=UPI000A77BE06|nr:hypothetical protein [Streptomyces cellulosae]